MPKTLNVIYEGIYYPMSSYLKIKEHEKLLGRKLKDTECIDIMMDMIVDVLKQQMVGRIKKDKDFRREYEKLKSKN